MGCGASNQSSAMEPQPSANGTSHPALLIVADSAASGDSDPEDANKNGTPPLLARLLQPFREVKAPIAFEVPGTDGEDGAQSIIQSHPPRRLRRLEDEQIPSQEEVEKRLALADQRRAEILRGRAKSARLLSSRGPRKNQLTPIATN